MMNWIQWLTLLIASIVSMLIGKALFQVWKRYRKMTNNERVEDNAEKDRLQVVASRNGVQS